MFGLVWIYGQILHGGWCLNGRLLQRIAWFFSSVNIYFLISSWLKMWYFSFGRLKRRDNEWQGGWSVEIRVVFFFICKWNKEYLVNLDELVHDFGFGLRYLLVWINLDMLSDFTWKLIFTLYKLKDALAWIWLLCMVAK